MLLSYNLRRVDSAGAVLGLVPPASLPVPPLSPVGGLADLPAVPGEDVGRPGDARPPVPAGLPLVPLPQLAVRVP